MKNLNITALWIILFIATFIFGGFYDFSVFFISAVLSINLLVKYIKNKEIKIELNFPFWISTLFVLGNFLTLFWAIDKNDAVFGLFRSIALFIFVLNLYQIDDKSKNMLKMVVPLSGFIMFIISIILAIIPSTKNIVISDGNRLTGFFQYANSYAIFLLLGIIILLNSEIKEKIKVPIMLLLVLAILLTGSRITFILLILNFIYYIVKSKSKNKLKYILGFVLVIAIIIIVALATNNFQNIGRILTLSFSSSTLLGRFVYYKDSLTLILKNIFGYGYMGYSYVYPEIQTAPYYIKFVHNDFLQIALDIGIIPALIFLCILVKALFSKNISVQNKVLLITLSIHMFFEFDLQFFVLLALLMIFMNDKNEKQKALSFSIILIAFCAILSIINCYYGIASVSNIFGDGKLGTKMLSNYTETKEKEAFEYYEKNNLSKADEIAKSILVKNKYSIVSYNIDAYYLLETKKYDDMVIQKNNAIELDKYNMQTYEDYVLLLSKVIDYYIKNEDYENANKYIAYVLDVNLRLEKLKENTDNFAYYFAEKPVFKLDDAVQKYIEVLSQNIDN